MNSLCQFRKHVVNNYFTVFQQNCDMFIRFHFTTVSTKTIILTKSANFGQSGFIRMRIYNHSHTKQFIRSRYFQYGNSQKYHNVLQMEHVKQNKTHTHINNGCFDNAKKTPTTLHAHLVAQTNRVSVSAAEVCLHNHATTGSKNEESDQRDKRARKLRQNEQYAYT